MGLSIGHGRSPHQENRAAPRDALVEPLGRNFNQMKLHSYRWPSGPEGCTIPADASGRIATDPSRISVSLPIFGHLTVRRPLTPWIRVVRLALGVLEVHVALALGGSMWHLSHHAQKPAIWLAGDGVCLDATWATVWSLAA